VLGAVLRRIARAALVVTLARRARARARARQAVLAGLKALKVLGVWGVSLEIDWGAAEPAPRQYNWAAYRPVLALVREAGLRLQVDFCFHADARRTLPGWVTAVGEALPDIWFTDKAGTRCRECLSLGVDDGEAALPACGACLAW
jgi:beta-amylase